VNDSAWLKMTWDRRTGTLHFESNIPHVEILGVVELMKSALIRQMASGQGAGVLAEGRLQQPALQVRRADRDS
jgi:hypothetical protein